MGQAYLDFAPKLVCQCRFHQSDTTHPLLTRHEHQHQGYKYSVFNLVFANNTASIKIWEKLGFSVIGRVPGCGNLANSDTLVDALIFGRELGS